MRTLSLPKLEGNFNWLYLLFWFLYSLNWLYKAEIWYTTKNLSFTTVIVNLVSN